jgi:uncharacterized low-complexity protein
MTVTRTSALLGATLASGALLSSPAFAMTDLAQGYALAASAPPVTGKATVPPPAEATATTEKQAAEHQHAEGKCGASTPAAEPKPADKADTKDAGTATDKGMEGKCGEGKCGASL